jgi:hypothetical protein
MPVCCQRAPNGSPASNAGSASCSPASPPTAPTYCAPSPPGTCCAAPAAGPAAATPAPARTAARARIRVALELTCWLAAQRRDLATATQADIDRWITAHPTRAPHARAFLAWARDRKLAGDIQIPTRPGTQPGQALPDRERWQVLDRCLHDQTLPVADRVAGALVLLYGQPLSHVVTLDSDSVQRRDGYTYLTLGSCPVRLPRELATLTGQLRTQATACPPGRRWLFPSQRPGEHLRPAALGARLRRLGPGHRTARNSALIALAAELPAPVLASLLGLHLNTAVRWTQYAQTDWAAYLAARADRPPSGTNRQRS